MNTPDAIATIRATMRDYGGPEDSPPARVMAGMLDLIQALEVSQRDLTTRLTSLPLGDVETALLRAARKAFLEATPEVNRVQAWQRWSAVACAAMVALGTLVMVGAAWWNRTPVVWDGADIAAQCATHQFTVEGGGTACQMVMWVKRPGGR